jgi:fumarate reductase subunit C
MYGGFIILACYIVCEGSSIVVVVVVVVVIVVLFSFNANKKIFNNSDRDRENPVVGFL